jgi:hypothetical protein
VRLQPPRVPRLPLVAGDGEAVRDIDALLKRLRSEDGFTAAKGKRSGHVKIRDKDGRIVAYCGSTPSNRRGLKNLEARLRRAGALR